MKVLISGGSGFIGSRIALSLVGRGHRVGVGLGVGAGVALGVGAGVAWVASLAGWVADDGPQERFWAMKTATTATDEITSSFRMAFSS